MKFILTTDNAGCKPAHFRELLIAADEGYLPVARIRMTQDGARPPAVVNAARALVDQANAAPDLLAVCEWALSHIDSRKTNLIEAMKTAIAKAKSQPVEAAS